MKTLALLALLAYSQAKVDARVEIDTGQPLAKLNAHGIGIGVAVWDAHMVDEAIPKLIKDAGHRVIRYPGGSYADLYHWKTGTATKGMQATIQPKTDFDSFMAMCQKAACTPLITVNYGSNPEGTGGAEPSEAAEWVRYANRTKKYGVKYWEIGNEVYGNGFYNGKGWEVDLHAPDTGKSEDRLKNPKLGPIAYGENVNAFVKAMKAEDPTVKVGAVLCTPGHWPDAVEPDWNSNVLKTCGQNIDFVVIHWYGEGKSLAEILAAIRQIPTIMEKVKAVVRQYCGPRADQVEIWMTEGDGSGINMRHSGALFAADFFATWLKYGAASVNWWNLHNGLHVASDGVFDDQGILSSGHTQRGVSQPPANTPFPSYWGQVMFSKFIRPGDTFLSSRSTHPDLVAHAARRPNGELAMLLINRDPDHTFTVALDVKGDSVGKRATRTDYTRAGLGKARSTTESIQILPPYSIAVIIFPRR